MGYIGYMGCKSKVRLNQGYGGLSWTWMDLGGVWWSFRPGSSTESPVISLMVERVIILAAAIYAFSRSKFSQIFEFMSALPVCDFRLVIVHSIYGRGGK
jgi:hypothetical protein